LAVTYAREAARIEVTNKDVQTLWIDCLEAAGKGDEATKLKKRFGAD
jgi:hypothetical protein